MTRYETLMLATPDIGQESIAKIEGYISDLTSKSKGKLLSFDVWGKYKLSYPVKKHDYGVYVLARFELDKSNLGALEELKSFFKLKCNDIVMRFINRQLSENTSLEYQKPEAIVSGEYVVALSADAKDVVPEGQQNEQSKAVSKEVSEASENSAKETEDVAAVDAKEADAEEQEGKE